MRDVLWTSARRDSSDRRQHQQPNESGPSDWSRCGSPCLLVPASCRRTTRARVVVGVCAPIACSKRKRTCRYRAGFENRRVRDVATSRGTATKIRRVFEQPVLAVGRRDGQRGPDCAECQQQDRRITLGRFHSGPPPDRTPLIMRALRGAGNSSEGEGRLLSTGIGAKYTHAITTKGDWKWVGSLP